MADERKISAKEAALAVLKKAEEVLLKSELMKAERVRKQVAPEDNAKEIKEGNNPAPGAFPQNEEKYGAEKVKKAEGQTLGSAIGYPGAPPTAPIAKEEAKTGAQRQAEGEARQAKIAQKEIAEDKGPRAGDLGASLKGHIKLAKFMGRMEHKRGLGKDGQKGVHPQQGERGMSPAGNLAVQADSPMNQEKAKDEHRKVLGEMKSMPKPKIPG